jgi:hypothetical protein
MYHVLHVSESVRGECLTHVTDQFALASFVTFASEIRLLRAIYDVNRFQQNHYLLECYTSEF